MSGASLTQQERRAELIARATDAGLTARVIAERMGITTRTVYRYRSLGMPAAPPRQRHEVAEPTGITNWRTGLDARVSTCPGCDGYRWDARCTQCLTTARKAS